MSIRSRRNIAILLCAALFVAGESAIQVAAAPPQQNPTRTPTNEPTRPPYVFPTPIFIPTYTSATDLPPVRNTTTPRPAGTVAGEQTYTVQPGDNPSLIAKKVYGDAGKFQMIVEANDLTDARRLRVGTVLIIPPLTPIATTPTPPSLAASSPQPTPAIAFAANSPSASPTRSAVFTPTPQPTQIATSLGGIAEVILRSLSIVFLLGSLAIAALAVLFYRDARRREKVSFIKRRLKGE